LKPFHIRACGSQWVQPPTIQNMKIWCLPCPERSMQHKGSFHILVIHLKSFMVITLN
jgi:hypothetical protein